MHRPKVVVISDNPVRMKVKREYYLSKVLVVMFHYNQHCKKGGGVGSNGLILVELTLA